MASLTAADLASRTMKKGWAKREEPTEEDDPGVLEKIARSMSGGRNRGQRALYNATRGDTVGEAIMEKPASEKALKFKMNLDASDARLIDEAVPRRKSPLYKKSDDSEED